MGVARSAPQGARYHGAILLATAQRPAEPTVRVQYNYNQTLLNLVKYMGIEKLKSELKWNIFRKMSSVLTISRLRVEGDTSIE